MRLGRPLSPVAGSQSACAASPRHRTSADDDVERLVWLMRTLAPLAPLARLHWCSAPLRICGDFIISRINEDFRRQLAHLVLADPVRQVKSARPIRAGRVRPRDEAS